MTYSRRDSEPDEVSRKGWVRYIYVCTFSDCSLRGVLNKALSFLRGLQSLSYNAGVSQLEIEIARGRSPTQVVSSGPLQKEKSALGITGSPESICVSSPFNRTIVQTLKHNAGVKCT